MKKRVREQEELIAYLPIREAGKNIFNRNSGLCLYRFTNSDDP